MNKKLLVSIFLCFFVFSICIIAQDHPSSIKHLVFAQTPPKAPGWVYYPNDDEVTEQLPEETFLTFHVPSSPSSNKLFIETWSSTLVGWTTWNTRYISLAAKFRVSSDVIPRGIEVWVAIGLVRSSERNAMNYADRGSNYYYRSAKWIMSRNSIGGWNFGYTDSEQPVPEELALSILNDLINKGFDLEVSTIGLVQGSDLIYLYFSAEVTGITKN